MKKRLLVVFLILFIPIFKIKAIDISYQSHVQNIGWQNYVSNGEKTGTEGKHLRLEAIKIIIKNNKSEYEGSIKYQAHVENVGWQNWKKSNEQAGTTGRSLRLEAIRIELTGALADHYDVYYRAHVQDIGWQDWVKNGELAGTEGESLRLESLEIKIIAADTFDNISFSYTSHSSFGWQDYVGDGEESGSTGKSIRLDSIKIRLDNYSSLKGSIKYQSYVTSDGWQQEKTSDNPSGIYNKNIEAIKIKLTDELAEKYNLFYRVHVQDIGWLTWTKNGEPAGTIGFYKGIEALEIKLQLKTESNVEIGKDSFRESINKISYSSHVQNIGWQEYVGDGEESGSTGQSQRLEAIKIKIDTKMSGNILYKTYVTKRGWTNESNSNTISGTEGLSRSLEAISIKLTGDISKYYNIYYRVHVSNIGWLSWTSNGNYAGCMNSNQKMEAIEIKMVDKNTSFSGDTSSPLRTGTWKNNNTNYYDYFGNKATGFKLIDNIKYYFNSDGKLIGKNVKKVIDVSSWQGVIDWNTIKKDEEVEHAVIRVGWGTSYNDPCGLDSYFDRNIKEVQRLGIPYALYIYAYAETTTAAQKEADFVISKMKQYNMPKNIWVWYDAEINSIPRSTYNTVIPAFANRMKSQGYNNVGVYSGIRQLDTTNGNTNTPTIRAYPIWVAQYYKELQYSGRYSGWQYASDERINGINGNVDVSMFYR